MIVPGAILLTAASDSEVLVGLLSALATPPRPMAVTTTIKANDAKVSLAFILAILKSASRQSQISPGQELHYHIHAFGTKAAEVKPRPATSWTAGNGATNHVYSVMIGNGTTECGRPLCRIRCSTYLHLGLA